MYVYIYMCTYICVRVYVYVYMCTCVCVRVYVCMCTGQALWERNQSDFTNDQSVNEPSLGEKFLL